MNPNKGTIEVIWQLMSGMAGNQWRGLLGADQARAGEASPNLEEPMAAMKPRTGDGRWRQQEGAAL